MGDQSSDEKRLSLAYLDLTEIPSNIGQKQLDIIEVLDISNNKFSDFRFLKTFPSLHTLILDGNNVQSHTKFPPMPKLHTLWLNKNKVSNLTIFVDTLVKNFPKLQYLSMMNNPAAPSYFNGGTFQQFVDYRQFVISQIPGLEVLDDKKVTAEERYEAERVYKHKFRSSTKKKKRKSQSRDEIQIPMRASDSMDSSS
ncbi:Leucine-rich melanocyte differentiation-associated protein [Holothuria leucospilota]|uniref:Leucine-rich melanocyte differentiation-associated protein n=1 Tax=Holothuria leucospilota TaxID=206669 RepID=A0A9Q1BJG7_HOLLE|nr:Leucine-rich melanocyte differentiation-associated protein [Holothuria leucospilota]